MYRKRPHTGTKGWKPTTVRGYRQKVMRARNQWRQFAMIALKESNWTYQQIETFLNEPQERLLGLTVKEALKRTTSVPLKDYTLWARRAYLFVCKTLKIKPLREDPKKTKKVTPVTYED